LDNASVEEFAKKVYQEDFKSSVSIICWPFSFLSAGTFNKKT